MNNNIFTEQLNFNNHIYGAKIWSIMFNFEQNCGSKVKLPHDHLTSHCKLGCLMFYKLLQIIHNKNVV